MRLPKDNPRAGEFGLANDKIASIISGNQREIPEAGNKEERLMG